MSHATDTHILVVDDDKRLRALLKQYLTEHGFFVSTAESAAQADQLLDTFKADLMVLDVMMPRETGLEYAHRLQQRTRPPLVLMLTAKGEPEDRIAGLEAGVGDYLAKPFTPRELVLRMQNMLKRAPSSKVATHIARFGDFRFDVTAGRLSRGGEPVYLTGSEIECLQILARSAGQPVSREQIAKLAGGISNERSVDVQINRLRKKIETNPGKPAHIQTVRHAGYVLHLDEAA